MREAGQRHGVGDEEDGGKDADEDEGGEKGAGRNGDADEGDLCVHRHEGLRSRPPHGQGGPVPSSWRGRRA